MRLRNILCAVDLADEHNLAIDYAKSLAGMAGAQLFVAHIVESRGLYRRLMLPHDDVETFMTQALNNAEQNMQAFVQAHCPDLPVKTIIREDEFPEQGLLQLIDELHIDLVVLATHARSEVDRFFFGSVADRVVRSAPCPVLSVQPGCPE